MLTTSGLAKTAALIGDPARANMLLALMDGRALTATELASAGGVTPQTASSHLAHMTQAGLLTVERQGRHRYHRLASTMIAEMLEGIMAVAATPLDRSPRLSTGPKDLAMRRARTCYDHLAGKIAVGIADQMIARMQVELTPDGGILTRSGAALLHTIGVDLDRAQACSTKRRLFCRPCLDWSERRPHLAGTVGAAMLRAYLANGWMHRADRSRVVLITPAGRQALDKAFAFTSEFWADAPL